MRIRLPLATLALCFTSAVVSAAPTVTGIGGTASDDQTLTISGREFGSNSLRQQWLGGRSGPIDGASNGARVDGMNLSGWSLMQPSTATYPHVSTERSWSNGKSIAFDTRGTREYKQTLFYDTGSAGYNYMYTNALIYLNHDTLTGGARLQWKMMRWTHTQTVVDGDGVIMSNWPTSASYLAVWNPSQVNRWFEKGFEPLPGRGAWYRYETWVRLNSASGRADGMFRVKVTNPTNGQVVTDNTLNDVPYNGSGQSGNLRWVVLQNYFGNASDGGSGMVDNANAVAWWDDIYFSQSQARVEVCAQPTWAQCQNREIQPAQSWNDSSITIKVNKGAISDLSNAYLYVTNANGEVNANGYRLVGGPVPNPPTNVSVQ